MKPFTHQELESCGFFSKLFGSTPTENAWKELNNLFADANDLHSISKDDVKKALKKWGVKASEENEVQRASIYRKIADMIYSDAMNEEEFASKDLDFLGDILDMPEHLVKNSNKNSRTAAYLIRCNRILKGEEKLTIQEIHKLFGYDYEDTIAMRKQVFTGHFNLKFEDISERARYTPEDEAGLRKDCENLDIPYEFKENIQTALDKYRNLWNVENQDIEPIQDESLPMDPGEECYMISNSGLCVNKTVEYEDNLMEYTRKFRIDEEVSFKGEKLANPMKKEDITAVEDIGAFLITNKRIIFFGKEKVFYCGMEDLVGSDFDGMNIVTYHTKENGDLIFKYPNESAEVIHIMFERVLARFNAQ
ncbi:MAG: hypothetical protein Q4D21_04425 [Phascolarctobacterium sp.]|nr:hypothetical protein [Phascolarctobacterium sp.]